MLMARRLLAEFVGTAILVFFAVGAAVFGSNKMGSLGVALAFGFTLLALAYMFGAVSGAHVNPAVTLGMVLGGTAIVRRDLRAVKVLVLTFSFASSCTAVAGEVNACNDNPWFAEGSVSQCCTSVVMSSPTH